MNFISIRILEKLKLYTPSLNIHKMDKIKFIDGPKLGKQERFVDEKYMVSGLFAGQFRFLDDIQEVKMA